VASDNDRPEGAEGIYVTYLPEDHHFDWRIHYSGPLQTAPFRPRVIFLTGVEFDNVVRQYLEQKELIGKGDDLDAAEEVHNPDE
jgi:hypothetical protein